MRVMSDSLAPIQHLSLLEPSDDRSIDNTTIERITQEVRENTYRWRNAKRFCPRFNTTWKPFAFIPPPPPPPPPL